MKMKVMKLLAVALIGTTFAACEDNDPTGSRDLTAPVNLIAQPGATSVTLTYGAVEGATSYVIDRAPGAAAFATIDTIAGTTLSDTGLLPTTTYRYRVHALSGTRVGPLSAEVTVTTTNTPVVEITTDITANRTLYADTVYKLSGFIHVTNGATLTIRPGTLIQGDYNTLGSSLFVLRGAKIMAVGTAAQPIVFTSSQPVNQRKPGDWGGIVIIGNGLVNRGNPQLEGTGTATGGGNVGGTNYPLTYGNGTDNTDSSGELSYVRVEFAGFAPAPNAELNSFTFAAVGSGTKMSYLQAVSGLDDAFEWFGGAADAKYLVSYNTGDDHFDASEGFSGRVQHMIALQSKTLIPRTGAGNLGTDPQGIENDGCDGAGCANGQNSEPFTLPIFANFTLVGTGPGTSVDGGTGGYGMVIRRGAGGFYVNGVVTRWPKAGLAIRDANTTAHIAASELLIANILSADNAALFQSGQQQIDSTANNVLKSNTPAASLFTSLPAVPVNGTVFDWTPAAGSELATGGLVTFPAYLAARASTAVTGTAYRGAADPNGAKWWQSWTVYLDS